MTTPPPNEDVVRLLQQVHAGKASAEELLPLVYEDLRQLARARMAKLSPGQTLQPSSLVHEAYLRILGGKARGWTNARHFFFAAARAMHDILVEQARRKATLKRGGDRIRVDPDHLVLAIAAPTEDMLALHEALERLERDDPRKRQMVELRFFAGLTMKDTARALGVSLRTLEREWRYVRALLHKELSGSDSSKSGKPDHE
jgi:RNA polymerase sigma factor (TIGR02999 family)